MSLHEYRKRPQLHKIVWVGYTVELLETEYIP